MKRLLSSKGIALWSSVLFLTLLLRSTSSSVRLANLEVVSPADSGPGTLRQALLDATAGDTITFNPSVFPPGSPVTLFVQSALPTLDKDNVTIDASNVGVIIDGSQSPGGTNGFTIEADNCVIQGLTIQYFPKDGIWIESGADGNTIGGDRSVGAGPNGQGNLIVFNGTSGLSIRGDANLVQGNYIGIDGSGWWKSGNVLNGVAIWEGATGNIVGGTTTETRNVISGNDQNGVWINGTGTNQNEVIGNYVGTRADGMGPVTNGFSGVAIQGGAKNNQIGGAANGEGNLISGNADNGIYIANPGTSGNQILGNIIGANWQGSGCIDQVDQRGQGVLITARASDNVIGSEAGYGRNLISCNAIDGVRIEHDGTMSNTVRGNYIGTNISGTMALPNGLQGVALTGGTHHNLIKNNLLSGNGSNGIILWEAHYNVVVGNLIGTDRTGTFAVSGQPGGGVDLTAGAQFNTIGGPTVAERNIISGNGVDGIFIEGWETMSNTIQGNYIGTDVSGVMAIPNNPWGLFVLNGAPDTLITGNLISRNAGHGLEVTYTAMGSEIISNTISRNGGAGIHFNRGAFLHQVMSNTITSNGLAGVWVEDGCTQNELSCNAIYDNAGQGIQLDGTANGAIAAPVLTAVTADTVTGTATANVRLEFFSDDAEEGRVWEGDTTADGDGNFSFSKPGGFTGPNVTAIGTDASGNTSEFSQPAHLLWTLLLYLNGDNDLEEYMFDTVDNIVAAGPSPRANVLALVDGYTNTVTYSGTVLYDLTYGVATPLATPLTLSGERNMGDGGTLVDFVTWGRAHYPARHTMLAIVDHGGGWAPSPEMIGTGPALARRRQAWSMGGSGLSWDFSDDYDYLDNREMRQALATLTGDGGEPLDVLFYDVCLMGLVEVAYEVQAYATFFVSSQNIGWAPIGSQGRYVRLIQGIGPATTPRQLAERTVQAYADGTPPEQHPFTISAVDLAQLPARASAVDQFAIAISDTLTSTAATLPLYATYSVTQKLDYDSDFAIEPQADGFVDLYDLASHASGQFSDANVIAAAHAVTTAFNTAIVAEQHRSGVPWLVPTQTWGLDGVHGLSIFLPLGEDLEFPTTITETVNGAPGLVLTRPLRLRDTYTADQLQFVGDTAWGDLIETYYEVVASPVPTDAPRGPVDGLITPDITPPQTTITVNGDFVAGRTITVTWVATDTQSGASAATLWRRPFLGQWATVSSPQSGSSGTFAFALPLPLCERCLNGLAVRTTDEAGNVEPLEHGSNTQAIFVRPCTALYMPVTLKRSPSAP